MKVSIITIVDNINYGTYLQAVATAKIINKLGCESEVINYVRPYISAKQTAYNYLENKSMSLLKRIMYAFFYFSLYPFMVWQVKRFLFRNANVTKRYKSFDELQNKPPKADVYLTGSDQVWNSVYNQGIDKAYFLGFVNAPKIAYAASVGLKSFSKGISSEIISLLSCYKSISVRESFGVEALNNIGIQDVCQVLDPTFLLEKPQWLLLANERIKVTEKYLLIYSVEVDRNDFILKEARKISKRMGLKIYWVCPTCKFKSSLKGVDRIFNFASVETFLNLMANADFVLASSFHGTAFAINFNKQFLSISPSAYNTRVLSLLKLCGLESRYVACSLMESDIDNLVSIDYDVVNAILNKERKKSLQFLSSALKDFTN